jgi:hypothetical protein
MGYLIDLRPGLESYCKTKCQDPINLVWCEIDKNNINTWDCKQGYYKTEINQQCK